MLYQIQNFYMTFIYSMFVIWVGELIKITVLESNQIYLTGKKNWIIHSAGTCVYILMYTYWDFLSLCIYILM